MELYLHFLTYFHDLVLNYAQNFPYFHGWKVTLFYVTEVDFIIVCSTSRKVAVSIADGVIAFFNLPNPSSHSMALGSTQKCVPGIFLGPKGGLPARKA
jgi:hypothetical protein